MRVTRPSDGVPHRCRACQAVSGGRGDLLCEHCWKLVPSVLVALYRLVWRLQHAQLAEEGTLQELDRLLVREVGDRKQATGATVSRSTPSGKVARVAVTLKLLAALPTDPAQAVTPAQLAVRARHDEKATSCWCSAARARGEPGLLARPVGGGAKRPHWVYWRAA